jgi:predicted transcriptional regulator
MSANLQRDRKRWEVNDLKNEDSFKLAKTESKFADLIWDNEPIESPELVKIAEREMKWKKSTTYTVLKKLCEKGIFKNENALVTAVLKKDEFYANQSRKYVEETFGGSLPKFLAAFVGGGKLNAKQAEELKNLIDEHKDEE